MSWTCCEHVVNMSWTCCEHVVNVVNMWWTCGEHEVNMSWTCREHVMNMLGERRGGEGRGKCLSTCLRRFKRRRHLPEIRTVFWTDRQTDIVVHREVTLPKMEELIKDLTICTQTVCWFDPKTQYKLLYEYMMYIPAFERDCWLWMSLSCASSGRISVLARSSMMTSLPAPWSSSTSRPELSTPVDAWETTPTRSAPTPMTTRIMPSVMSSLDGARNTKRWWKCHEYIKHI